MAIPAGAFYRSSRSYYSRGSDDPKALKRDMERMKEDAALKGFKSVQEYISHRARQIPGRCGFLYNNFVELQCVSRSSMEVSICKNYRNRLVSDCNAVWDGKTLQFPDKSHLNMQSYHKEKLDRRNRDVARAGCKSTKEYVEHLVRQSPRRCKVLSKLFKECASQNGSESWYCNYYRERLSEECNAGS